MDVLNLNKDNFKATIEGTDKTIIVDFYADWCMPCKMLSPILKEIALEDENILIYKVDIDANPELASEYGVRSIPTLISFKGGELYKRSLGAQPKESVLELTQ